MVKSPQVSIITITFNSEKTIKKCLESVLKSSPEVETIVVDNNSSDRSSEIIKSLASKVKLIESEKNLGFSRGNNLAVKFAKGKYLVFLNPDTYLTTLNGFDLLKKNLEDNPRYGLIGPKLIYPNGKVRKTARNLPTIWRAFCEYILGKKGVYDFYQPSSKGLSEVESVVGACMMIKKEVFEKIGGFDEKYFLYYEDLQLCKDIKNLGLKVGYFPEVVAEHIEGVSGSGQKTSQMIVNSAKKYHGLISYYLIQLILTPQRMMNKIKALTND